MDNSRLFLIMALALVSMLLWEAWQEDYVIPKQQAQAIQAGKVDSIVDTPDAPINASIDTPAGQALPSLPKTTNTANDLNSHLIKVVTDTFDMRIDTRGGSIVDVKLIQYPVSADTPEIKYHLMSQRPSDYFITQSGLLGAEKTRTPTHEAIFSSSANSYELAENADEMVVDLVWSNDSGLSVTKRYTFTRNNHLVTLQHIVNNNSQTTWTGREYRQFQRGEPAESGGNMFMYTYTGAAVFSEEDKYQKFDFSDLLEGQPNIDTKDGWIAMIQHYFLGAFIPPRIEPQHFYGKQLANGRYVVGSYTQAKTVNAGEQAIFEGGLFIGPKLNRQLEQLANGLDLTVDYGWLAMIAKPMHWVLNWINDYTSNWGWTIIIFTIMIKLVFFKLSETSYKSMANMRKMSPRIQALKDRFGDDKQRMQAAMMELYKKEKINPLGGCLPMLIQIPFFISLYWVLLENVDMRQAPWIFWLKDLSIKDPYFVLPVIMSLSMVVQQRLNPAPPDPMQAKIMMFLPLVFGIMFAFFPSGLVLYWVVNNLLSISQQWVITRRIEAGDKS